MRHRRVTVLGASGFVGRYVGQAAGGAGRGHRRGRPARERRRASCGRWAMSARSRRSMPTCSTTTRARGGGGAAPISSSIAVGILYERGAQRHSRRCIARLPARLARRGAAGWREAVRACLGASAPMRNRPPPMGAARRRAKPLCAPPSPTRSCCGPRSCSGRRMISSTASAPLARMPAGAAAHRRRRDAVPAGLCRRCRRRGDGGAGPPDDCGRPLRTGRARSSPSRS